MVTPAVTGVKPMDTSLDKPGLRYSDLNSNFPKIAIFQEKNFHCKNTDVKVSDSILRW